MKTLYIYDSISPNCSYNEMFQTKAVEKIRTRIFNNLFFFRKSYRLWGNVEKYYRAGQATDGNTRFACWIAKATNTRSEYVILIAFHGNKGYANAPKCYVNTYNVRLVKISIWFIYF
jgi:DUF1680 family protein